MRLVRYAGNAAGLALLTMACAAATAGGSRTVADLNSEIETYGFNPLVPPSTLLPPGTVAMIRSREPLRLQVVCSPADSLGSKLSVSRSGSREIARNIKDSDRYYLGAEFLSILSAGGEYSTVEEISMRLTDVEVQEIPDTSVETGIHDRSESCTKAIARRVQNRSELTMIKAVLKATVTYDVHFKKSANVDATARLAVVKGLAAKLGADSSSATDESIRGVGLFWGIYDDATLATIGESQPYSASSSGSRRQLLPRGAIVANIEPPDNLNTQTAPPAEETKRNE